MTSANGHVPPGLPDLASFTVPLSGPVSAWTPPGPDTPRRRRHADGDTVIRALAAFVVLAVAAFAAVVSYSHIFELGRHNGQDGTAARLLPLSVDGLIAAASLVMLHAARRELDVPQLARWMLGLGVGATVAANVEYGMPFGWLAAVISAWPAVAFVGSVEMAVRFVRDSRTAAAGDMTDDDMMAPPRHDTAATPAVDKHVDNGQDKTPDKPSPRRTALDRAALVIRRHPDWTDAAAAKSAGVSAKTVQRARKTIDRSTT